eukprot:m.196810 g.196810  ORF g.196810 m.196810 type:complete len:115 (-) comp25858_c1_seq7:799-1143(-)
MGSIATTTTTTAPTTTTKETDRDQQGPLCSKSSFVFCEKVHLLITIRTAELLYKHIKIYKWVTGGSYFRFASMKSKNTTKPSSQTCHNGIAMIIIIIQNTIHHRHSAQDVEGLL